MIKRGRKTQIDTITDNLCPICGCELIISGNITSCSKCDYQCMIINPHSQDYSIRCMVCGTKIQSGQLCDKCKERMLGVHKQLEFKNSFKNT